MTKETLIRVHRIYSIVLSIVIVIAGICLIAGCITIYNTGDKPFSREVVAETFSGIAFPVLLCLGMIILSLILELVLPSDKEKNKIDKPYQSILNRLYTNKDLSKCDASITNEINALQKGRKRQVIVRAVVLLIAGIIFLVYALNGSHFHQSEINTSMIHAMWILIPCLVVSFGYALFVTLYNEKSIQKEIELLKQAPSLENKPEETAKTASDKKLNTSRCVILAIGIIFVVYGFISGGTADVLTKAINICTECIGLG